MDSLNRRIAMLVGAGLSTALSLTGCNPDPTDPENVDPITLVNDTSAAVQVSWCSGDGGDVCSQEMNLGPIPAGTVRQAHISSYEVVLAVRTPTGPARFLCEVNAPGSRITLSTSQPSVKSAYDHCADGQSRGISMAGHLSITMSRPAVVVRA